MKRSFIFIVFLIFFIAVAQGVSPVKVNKIVVSPSPFKVGDALTFTVEIENTSNSTYGCVNTLGFIVQISVFKSDTSEKNLIWVGSQKLTTPLSAGEKRTVTLTSKWKVPPEVVDINKIIFRAYGPACAEGDLLIQQNAELTCYRSCSFAPLKLIVLPPLKIKK